MTSGPRFVFYANELIGLGHLRRTLALAACLSGDEAHPTSLILTGAPVEPTFRLPPRVDTVKLPGGSRDAEGNHRARRLELEPDELRSLRAGIALAATHAFEPDVVVVDKLPLGQRGELEPTLRALRQRGDCRLVLGLRDIEDSPENVRRKWTPAVRQAIERHYDAVLVYGPESTPDAIDVMGWDDLEVPVHHVGYVGTAMPDHGPDDLAPGYVLATAGGGFDGFHLLATFAEALRVRPLPCPTVMVTGPMMQRAERERLRRLTDGLDVLLCELRQDMEHVIAGARAVVSMAGYNSVSEVMRARKPALLVPRSGPSQEQLLRAIALAGAGLQGMLHPAELSPARLRRALDELLGRGDVRDVPADYRGTESAVRILADLAGAARAGGVRSVVAASA
jgi:predicted glycosyltransferase